MKKTLAISLIAMMAATNAHADAHTAAITQADDAWFLAGQDFIQQQLAKTRITGKAKNIILLVADGNGVGTNYATRLFAGQQAGGMGDDFVLPYEAFPNVALVKTYSTNGQTPDSAPTAAAMNSGVKTRNDLINITSNVAVGDCVAGAENGAKTFAEIVSEAGKSVGVISTARLTHATPAAVYARTVNRDWEDNTAIPEGCAQMDIAAQLAEQMKNGVIDIAMGGGRRHFITEDTTDAEGRTGKRTDGRNIPQEIVAMGGAYVQTSEEFMAMSAPGNAPILGLFEASHMMYEADRTGEPSLAEMTEAAIKALSANENGFFLEVEAGRVDHANHGGNLARTLRDGLAFADAVRIADALTDDTDTLIIVTADHGHAIAFNGYCGRGSDITGLCMGIDEAGEMHNGEPLLAADGKPYTVAGYLNGTGSVLKKQADGTYSGARPDLTQEEATDIDYLQQALIPMSSETHSGEDVAVYAKGPWAHLFDGVVEQNVIFHVMHYAATAE